MPTFVINNIPYSYPEPKEVKWAQKHIAWASAVSTQLDNLQTQILNVNAIGQNNTASNLGVGEGVYSQKVLEDLQFKSLVAGTNINLSSTVDEITINTLAEINTASNVGASGGAVFKQKSGVDLEFRKIIGGTDIDVIQNADDLTINFTGTSSGDVVGPASATDNAIPLYNGATGNIIKNSPLVVDPSTAGSMANSVRNQTTRALSATAGLGDVGSYYIIGSAVPAGTTQVTHTLQLTTSGRPVMWMMSPDNSGGFFNMQQVALSMVMISIVRVKRNSTIIAEWQVYFNDKTSTSTVDIPPGAFNGLDISAGAGTHTYEIEIASGANTESYFRRCTFNAWEI